MLLQFRRLRLPVDPDVSARKFLSDQEVISLLGDFWQFEENARHSILVTRQVNCSFSLKCLAQFLL